MNRAIRAAVDIGGTFTDVVLDVSGQQTATKVLTTYDDPANAVITGLVEVCRHTGTSPGDVSLLLHGTTLATNALIERRGARTALLTTSGHRDALEMALENRFEQYDLNIDRPAPLVPRYLRLPIIERVDASGDVLIPLDEASIHTAIAELKSRDVRSVAVGLLHAFVNPQHEERIGRLLQEALPDVAVSLSSQVCPEIREYERLSTTCANAYVKPLMHAYLTSLEQKLERNGFQCPLLLMTSGGGLTTLDAAREFPIRLVESGPAGGAILAADISGAFAMPSTLSFDMGGTTAKLCILDQAQPLHSRAFEVDRSYRFKKGSGLPVRIPVIEMVEIGAGGGSLARVDLLGRTQVGPESAGSEPGPACYRRGGSGATVTDADLVLGKIDPEQFAAGQILLDIGAAERALLEQVGDRLAITATAAAHAISEVVNENMAAAARAHLSEWGKGVSGRTLIAFGGAAPLHACVLAHKLKLDRIIVPANAGVGSAVGFLLAPVSFEVVRSRYMRLDALDLPSVSEIMTAMRNEARMMIGDLIPVNTLIETRTAYMRYLGQGYEIAVPLNDFESMSAPTLRDRFESEYRQLYGRTIPGLAVEILSWTLSLTGPKPRSPAPDSVQPHTRRKAGSHRKLLDVVVGEEVDAACFQRDELSAGDWLVGPALIAEAQTTVFVAGGYTAVVSRQGHLVITRDALA